MKLMKNIDAEQGDKEQAGKRDEERRRETKRDGENEQKGTQRP